jgi:hypothetical protein
MTEISAVPRRNVSTVTVERVDEQWVADMLALVDEGDSSGDVQRLRSLLTGWAEEFAELRADVQSARLVEPRRGLRDDEARSFLRAVEHGFAHVDKGGYVSLPLVRPKRPAGRYALLAKSGSGVSINLEYIVQVGATAELLLDYGWDGRDIDFERGEFDALAFGSADRPLLVMEAKARATGPDSLESLMKAWLSVSRTPETSLETNAGRKWRELARLSDNGPLAVWLVSDGARWTLSATRMSGGAVGLQPASSPDKADVLRFSTP